VSSATKLILFIGGHAGGIVLVNLLVTTQIGNLAETDRAARMVAHKRLLALQIGVVLAKLVLFGLDRWA